MSTHIRLSLLGVFCLVFVSVPFIAWGQTGDLFWESSMQVGVEAYQQGNDDEAENQFLAALQIAKNFGLEDPRLATSLNNLASLYQAQRKYAQAELLFERALAIREKSLGPEHPDLATSLNNLGSLYHNQEKYSEAKPLYWRSLAIREKALGLEHLRVAESLSNLAVLYNNQGKYAEAEPLFKRSLEIRETSLGPEHPGLATNLINLAELYRAQGKYSEAKPLLARTLEIWVKALGPEHSNVALGLENYATLLKEMDRETECRLRFTVVKGNEASQANWGAWPERTIMWWILEGEKKYPELCYSSRDEADFLVVWERSVTEISVAQASQSRQVLGCEPPVPVRSRTRSGVADFIYDPLQFREYKTCMRVIRDASGARMNRADRQVRQLAERMSVTIHRAPTSNGTIRFSKPISSTKKEGYDPRKVARDAFQDAMKNLQKEAKEMPARGK